MLINKHEDVGLKHHSDSEAFIEYSNDMDNTYENLKGCVRYIFASLFFGLNESTCQMKRNVFYFTSKPLSVFEKIKFWNSTLFYNE